MSFNYQQPSSFIQMSQTQPQPNYILLNRENSVKKSKTNHEDLKARNRVAAKKWRDKKDEVLSKLEIANDQLRHEAFKLRNEALSLKTENEILENELNYFQSFMSRIMNKMPSNPNQPLNAMFNQTEKK